MIKPVTSLRMGSRLRTCGTAAAVLRLSCWGCALKELGIHVILFAGHGCQWLGPKGPKESESSQEIVFRKCSVLLLQEIQRLTQTRAKNNT